MASVYGYKVKKNKKLYRTFLQQRNKWGREWRYKSRTTRTRQTRETRKTI